MIGNNALAWSLQIAALVGIAAAAEGILRLRAPGARLLYWQLALAACLLLPLVRPWRQHVVDLSDPSVSVSIVLEPQIAAHRHISPVLALLWLLVAGVLVRIGWLAAGFWRLRQHRRHARPFGTRDGATLLLSDEITSPVTFGALRPVVLLPLRFAEFEASVQEAMLCHELLHVRRRDWLFTVAEEMVRSLFWFHPAIWWLLGEIGLAREQEVDRLVVERTRLREEYVDALLAIAGARPQLDLAPAPLFLRRRHLKQRVVSILKEVRMSKTRLISSMAAALGILAAACWLVTAAFPLAAAPQVVADAPGVSIDLGGAGLLHRTPVEYPAAARQNGVQGVVIVQVKLDGGGNVADSQVLSGPEELRNAALRSVVNWHFGSDVANSVRQVSISFQAGPATAAAPKVPTQPFGTALTGITVRQINILGVSDQARADLLSRLPVHVGDALNPDLMTQIAVAIKSFDQHLDTTYRSVMKPASGGTGLQTERSLILEISPTLEAPRAATAESDGHGGMKLHIGGNVQAAKLINQPKPAYPPEAKEARIQGVVKLNASIGADGKIEDLSVISGHPLLVPAALDAVRQWVYQPTLLNGQPVPVATEIDVNFTLSQ